MYPYLHHTYILNNFIWKTLNFTLISEFRPISFLIIISKIQERVGVEQQTSLLFWVWSVNSRNTVRVYSALPNGIDEIRPAKDKDLKSVLTTFNFSQAIDSVNFDFLMAKLRLYQFNDISKSDGSRLIFLGVRDVPDTSEAFRCFSRHLLRPDSPSYIHSRF